MYRSDGKVAEAQEEDLASAFAPSPRQAGAPGQDQGHQGEETSLTAALQHFFRLVPITVLVLSLIDRFPIVLDTPSLVDDTYARFKGPMVESMGSHHWSGLSRDKYNLGWFVLERAYA